MSYLSFVCAVEQAWYKYVCVFSLFKRRGENDEENFFFPSLFPGEGRREGFIYCFLFFLNFFKIFFPHRK